MNGKTGIPCALACALAIWLSGPRPAPSAEAAQATPIDIQMKNVTFRIASDIALEIRTLRGELRRTRPDVPVTFDDGSSFDVDVDTAEVAMTPAALSALMNSYVLAYEGSPIKNVSVSIEGGRLVQKGTVHKGVDLPFEIVGALSTTPDGEIRMHADKIKAAHLPVKGLLHVFGEDLSKLVNANAGRGMKLDGDNIILDPRKLTPPPHLNGRVTRVAIAGGKVVQYFDAGRHLAALKPPVAAPGYIYHRNGVLRFGKLTMIDADLEIVGDRPGPFEFFQREYKKQLVAGYSKNTPTNGLVAHMVDYSRFRAQPANRRATGGSSTR
jgi:hypothetical protein